MAGLEITSSAFAEGEPIPQKYSCEGEDVSPPFAWSEVPDRTRSLALIVHDPDAPSGDFVHWVTWGIDPATGGLAEGEAPPLEGTNGFGNVGYSGPCPPPGHGPHRYFHILRALDSELELAAGAGRDELEGALEAHTLDSAELVGTYERS